VNSSRGPVVDEKGPRQSAEKIKSSPGRPLDVFEERASGPADSPLSILKSPTACGLFHHFASGAPRSLGFRSIPTKGMAGRTAQAVIDVLEGNYGGDPTKMPYVCDTGSVSES